MHRNAQFLINSKSRKSTFCAFWMQLRICKLRQLKIYISGVTYFGLVKKYEKLASIKYFKVRSYLQKPQICNEKSMKMAHRKT